MKPAKNASPYIHARYQTYLRSRTLGGRASTAWWTLQHLLFTGYVPGTARRYFASQSQPSDNWPFAIWRRTSHSLVARVLRCL